MTAPTTSPGEDLVAALAALDEPVKTGKANVPGRQSYSYMQLPDLLRTVRETLAKHRMAVMQQLHSDGEWVTVVTVLIHASGERWQSDPLMIRTRGAAQDIGSAATYARRYSLAAFVGLAGDDDDDGRKAQTSIPPQGSDRTPAPLTPEEVEHTKAQWAAKQRGPAKPIPPPADFKRGSIRKGTASDASVRKLWTLLTATGWDQEHIRGYVQQALDLDTTAWHTSDLSQYQVSMLIDRLIAADRPTDDTPELPL